MSARAGSDRARVRRAGLGALAALLAMLAIGATAQADEVPNHPFIKTLIGGLEEEPKPPHAVLDAPCGVAVEPGGGLLVSDYYRKSILNTSLPDYYPYDGPCALATDGENLYVNYWHGGVVNRDFGVVDPRSATGIAVDPVNGDLYINHRTSIAVYKAPVHSGEVPQEIGAGTLVDGYGIAVSDFAATAGDIYVGDASNNTVKVYNPAQSLVNPVGTINGAGTPQGRFVSLREASLAFEQSTGHLLVVDDIKPESEHPLAAVDEFNADGLYRGQLEHDIVDGEPTGIAVDDSATESFGQIYVTSGNGTTAVTVSEVGPPEDETGALLLFGAAGAGQTLEATTSGTGTGSVTSNPAGINCPGACKAELNSGAVVNLSANPALGSAFAGWSGSGCTGTGSCQVTLSSASAVDAKFEPAPVPHAIHSATNATAQAPATPTTDAPGALRLGKASAAGQSVLLEASVPGPGTLTIAGQGIKRSHTHFAHAGPITLALHLNEHGRRALARSKAGALALHLHLAFTPSQGPAGVVIAKTVTFKRK